MSNLCCHGVSINTFCHCNIYRALWLRGQNWYSTSIVVKLLHIKISRIRDMKRDFKCQTPGPHCRVWIPMCLIWIQRAQHLLLLRNNCRFVLQTGFRNPRLAVDLLCSAVHLMVISNWNEVYGVDILYKAVEFDPVWQWANLPYQSVTTSNRDRHFLELFVSISLIFSELNGKKVASWQQLTSHRVSSYATEPAWRSCECFWKMKHGSCAPWSPILVSLSFT